MGHVSASPTRAGYLCLHARSLAVLAPPVHSQSNFFATLMMEMSDLRSVARALSTKHVIEPSTLATVSMKDVQRHLWYVNIEFRAARGCRLCFKQQTSGAAVLFLCTLALSKQRHNTFLYQAKHTFAGHRPARSPDFLSWWMSKRFPLREVRVSQLGCTQNRPSPRAVFEGQRSSQKKTQRRGGGGEGAH